MTGCQTVSERRFVDDVAAARLDQNGPRPHERQFGRANHAVGFRQQWHVHRDDVGTRQKLTQCHGHGVEFSCGFSIRRHRIVIADPRSRLPERTRDRTAYRPQSDYPHQ
jgi:hypothetical protein